MKHSFLVSWDCVVVSSSKGHLFPETVTILTYVFILQILRLFLLPATVLRDIKKNVVCFFYSEFNTFLPWLCYFG